MFRLIIFLLCLLLVVGCNRHISRHDMSKIQTHFESTKNLIENDALNGKITWVQAVTKVRNLDKAIEARLDYSGATHDWIYDSAAEEYYAHCIAIAEKLDKKEISFAAFDASRKKALNHIMERRQSLEYQKELVENTRRRQLNCVTENIHDKYETRCY